MPFLPLTAGEMTMNFVPSASDMIFSMMTSVGIFRISLPQTGQCGIPILA